MDGLKVEPAEELKKLAAATLGPGLSWARLAGDGSTKSFWRVFRGARSWVAVDGSGLEAERKPENRAFWLIGRHLAAQGLPVAAIVAARPEEGFFLIEDLGDELLAAAARRMSRLKRREVYERVLALLLDLQIKGGEGFDPAWCAQSSFYDEEVILKYEARYFMTAFIQGVAARPETFDDLAQEFIALARSAAAGGWVGFLHRDFQSRNIILQGHKIRIIDYQAARLGPLGYDLASLLIDPYVGLSPREQEWLLSRYVDMAAKRGLVKEAAFRRQYAHLALCRNLQVLGAFGYLSQVKGRPGFAEYIPAALSQLKWWISRPEFDDYPGLRRLAWDIKPGAK